MATSLTPNVLRPGFNTAGKAIKVQTNFFSIEALPTTEIFHYDVTVTPDVPPPVNRRVYKSLLSRYRVSDFGGLYPVYDGRKNMFTARELGFESRTFDVVFPDDVNPRSKKPAPKFTVKIRRATSVNLKELHDFLASKGPMTNMVLTSLMCLDVLIRHKPAMLYTTIGRSIFTPDASEIISGGLEIWTGFYQSVRPAGQQLMINVDTTATTFYQKGPLLDVLIKMLNVRGLEDLISKCTSDTSFVKRIDRILKGLKITATHGKNTTKEFKIFRVTDKPASEIEFTRQVWNTPGDPQSAEDVSTKIVDYFQTTYGIRLKHPGLPCVQLAKRALLPLELCSIVQGQRYVRKLNERQTADMITYSSKPPTQRSNNIKKGITLFDYPNNEFLESFGMRVSSEMITVNARVLAPPDISFRATPTSRSCHPVDGAWNMRDRRVTEGVALVGWGVLVFALESEALMHKVSAFIRTLASTCISTGMPVENPNPPIIFANPNPINNVEKHIKAFRLKTEVVIKAEPQLLLIVLPNTGTTLYAETKRVCDTLIGVTSQCMQLRHLNNPNVQYCANLCLKMNVKLGGETSFISPNQLPFFAVPTLVIGMDVSHASPGSQKPSVAAAVGSLNRNATKYACEIRIQTSGTETIADLGGMMLNLLKRFYKNTGTKPQRILAYRDGVSESQFEVVRNQEIVAIKYACEVIEKGYSPSITFVVVQKRHHVRFFPVPPSSGDRTGNCKPGTTVDSTITHPFEFDWYTQSHGAILGTSRPAHYHVLLDENRMTPQHLQQLTYHMCHLYARCTRSVSMVPAGYYAHLAALRGRHYLKGAEGGNWSDTASMTTTSSGLDELIFLGMKKELVERMSFM